MNETFTELLFSLIDNSGKTDVEIYKEADIDRRHFSKIRGGLVPRKETIIRLAIALQLTEVETNKLLMKAGYALSDCIQRDVLVSECIKQKKFDIWSINYMLSIHNLKMV